MTTDLYYLTLTCLLCMFLWLPYIGARALKYGLLSASDYKKLSERKLPIWVARAHRSHMNLLENLPHFAALVLVAHAAGMANSVTATACMVFFWARIAHAVVFVAGTAYVRTLAFFAGFVAELVIAYQILA